MRSKKYQALYDFNEFDNLLDQTSTFKAIKDEEIKAPKEHKKVTDSHKKNKVHWYSILLLIVDLFAIACFFIAYGPFGFFRNWVVTTAVHTTQHRQYAYVLYTENMVEKVKMENSAFQSEKATDTSLITFKEADISQGYSSVYEQQILERKEGQEYKIIPIEEDKYKGFLTVIYEPKRLSVVMAQASNGDTILQMAKRMGAQICVNGGTFARNWDTKVIYPNSSIIVNGEVFYERGEAQNLIGMNKDGVLCLYNMTAEDGVKAGLDWAVCFSPYLIVNGIPTEFTGNGGYGIQPRTAIGQRSDGIVLLLTIDGRGANNSKGISVVGLQEIFLRYGCVNAANLDGGGSTTLVENGKILNSPMGGGSTSGQRHVYNAIYFK